MRLIASPESVLNRFYTEKDLAEDQLIDSLILGGPKILPLLECEILKKETPRRLYAIYALSILGKNDSIPSIEHILQDKSEPEDFRAAAFQVIARIDLIQLRHIALLYQSASDDLLCLQICFID